MDNFMEKITHKFSAADMIKANQQADAIELDEKKEQLRLYESQMEQVDSAISEIRELNLKNIESAQDVRELAKVSSEKIGDAVNRMENETVSKIRETSDLSIAGINKTVDESIAKIEEIKVATDSKEVITASMDAQMDKISTMRRELEEYMHSDHVRVYRNVQASFTEELTKQIDEVKQITKKTGAIFTLVIIAAVISCADLVINILRILGII